MGYTEPQFVACALITIDAQRAFLDGEPLQIVGTSKALPAIQSAVDLFRSQARPVIHMVRIYKADGTNVDLCRRARVEEGLSALAPGAPGTELALTLRSPLAVLDPVILLSGGVQQIGPSESVIYKPRWGAFFQTALEAHLRRLSTTTLVFCGCNFPNCPRTSIYEASERDFRIALLSDAVSGFYERGGAELTNIGVELLSIADLETILSGVQDSHT
jgi:nicotinamidase-related amidase